MGASGSKECSGGAGEVGQSSGSNLNVRKRERNKFRGSSVFGSSCIGLACTSDDTAHSVEVCFFVIWVFSFVFHFPFC